jgi:hypothetical protein
MNTGVDWLSQLAPEHAPAAPSWWPPAPGWWLLGIAFIVTVSALLWWRFSPAAVRDRRRKHAALEELGRIQRQVEIARVAPDLQRLLRRFALTMFERDRIAPLSGEAWLEFLAQYGDARFAGDVGRSLLAAAYGKPVRLAWREPWLEAAEAFIRQAPKPLPKRGESE